MKIEYYFIFKKKKKLSFLLLASPDTKDNCYLFDIKIHRSFRGNAFQNEVRSLL